MSLVDNITKNPNVARILCVAIAAEAARSGEEIDSKELSQAFSYIVRKLDRRAFTEECRKLEKLGAAKYLSKLGDIL